VLTTTAPGQPLRNGIVLCRVVSWLTGTLSTVRGSLWTSAEWSWRFSGIHELAAGRVWSASMEVCRASDWGRRIL